MKIIITETFQNDFKKFIWKNFKICNLMFFSSILYKFVITKWFYLNRPFMKLKFDFCNKAIRLLIVYDEKNNLIIPIFITDKNDKLYWYNMNWDNIRNKWLNLFEKMSIDIENNKFTEF